MSHLPRYIDSLPQGLESYPACMVNRDVFEHLAQDFPALVQLDLPDAVAALVAGQAESWVPEVIGNAAFYAARDTCEDDAAFLRWAYNNTNRVFQKPVYRVLMKVLSPALVAMNGAKRWDSFHRGTELSARPLVKTDARLSTEVVITHPPHLYGALLIGLQGESFRALVEGAGGQNVQVDVDPHSAEEARIKVAWDR